MPVRVGARRLHGIRRNALASSATRAWNPADVAAGIAVTNNNRTAVRSSGSSAYANVRSITGHSTGKWYAEANPAAFTTNTDFAAIGLAKATAALTNFFGTAIGTSYGFYADGNTWFAGASIAHLGNAYAAGEAVRLAGDFGAQKLWFGDAVGWCGGGDPEAGTLPTYSAVPAGTWFLGCTTFETNDQSILNTGQATFVYPVPAGFSVWG